MNKKQQRELENKIREAIEEPAELTEDEIADIRNRAYRAYQKKMDDKKRPSKSGLMKSGLLRRVVAVFAIAIGLIVMSVVYSVIAPVTSSSANSFVRRAAIWVNDQLHLGISFPVPEEESNASSTESEFYSSLIEASKDLNMPIVYFQNVDELEYKGLETISAVDESYVTFLHYGSEHGVIDISIECFREDEILDITPHDSSVLSSPIGDVYVWHAEGVYRAITFYNNYIIEIYGNVSEESFLKACNSLSLVN